MQITGGKFNSRKILSPKGDNVRPTLSKTRSAIFDMLQGFISFEDKSFLDLFAGSGVMGLEAISRGFTSSYAIEKDYKTFVVIKKNYELLGVTAKIFCSDSIKILSKLDKNFDVIYIDPPYQAKLYEPSLLNIKKYNVLSNNGIVILEAPSDLKIDTEGYEIIKQKSYSDKTITFLQLG